MTRFDRMSTGNSAKSMALNVPVPVLENEEIKLLWDFTIQVDREIAHYRPDIVIFNKVKRYCLIVDVAMWMLLTPLITKFTIKRSKIYKI